MYSFLSKHGQVIALCVGALITIIFFAIIGANGSTFSDLDGQQLKLKDYNDALSQTSIFNFGIVATLFLVAITALAVAVFGVLGVVTDFKNSKKGLIGFAVVLVLFIVAYFVSSSSGDAESVMEVISKMNEKSLDDAGNETINTVTPGRSSYISASLITTMVLGGLAFVGMVASEIWNLFR